MSGMIVVGRDYSRALICVCGGGWTRTARNGAERISGSPSPSPSPSPSQDMSRETPRTRAHFRIERCATNQGTPKKLSAGMPFTMNAVIALFGSATIASSKMLRGLDACWSDPTPLTTLAEGKKFSVNDAKTAFKRAKGPFKMMEGGDAGPSLTTIEEGSLRASYPAGKVSGKQSGFSLYDISPEGSALDAWMSYKLRLSENFDFTRGGKLPGLCGGPDEGRGRTCPVGCSSVGDDDGFSARLMWRKGGALTAYLYYPDKPSSIRCGEDFPWSTTLIPGKWHDILFHVHLNGFDKNGQALSDARIEGWFDGEKALDLGNLVLRRSPSVHITRTYVTTYVGGSSVELFAPRDDQFAWFKDVRSWTGSSSACISDSRDPSPSPKVDAPAAIDSVAKLFEFEALIPGYDRPGFFKRTRIPAEERRSLYRSLRFCRDDCNATPTSCLAFTLYGTSCYLKDANIMDRALKWYGRGASGLRFMYERVESDEDSVIDQSREPCGDAGLECCYEAASTNGSPLCGHGSCSGTETQCVCSSGECVDTTCSADEICEQSLGPCGASGEPCCPGSACEEDHICDSRGVCVA